MVTGGAATGRGAGGKRDGFGKVQGFFADRQAHFVAKLIVSVIAVCMNLTLVSFFFAKKTSRDGVRGVPLSSLIVGHKSMRG